MENPLWTLASKAASVMACLLLVAGATLVGAVYLDLSTGSFTALVATVAAAVVAVFALVASQFDIARLARRQQQAVEAANLLSQGVLLDTAGEGELLASLQTVSDYLKERAKLAREVAEGRPRDHFTPLSDSDELGAAMQELIASLKNSVETQDARTRLHDSVVKLLDDVSGIAEGDLTVHAEVGAELTGAVADAFNSMTENLRRLIRQVKQITKQVGASTSSISETTEQLARGSVAQASQIARTTAAMTKMAVQIQEVSRNAEQSTKVASDSLNKARSGTAAAADNINAMRCVRKQVQETSKRVKRLGERSQEIGQIVALIDELSDRTSLLALNASLQAASAGEAGAAFASVAEEVERLAERSNKLTRQISSLTQTINIETKDVVASMEDTIREVVIGSALADKAGQSLVAIETTSTKLADLLRSISDSSKYQAKSAEDISGAMDNILEVTGIVETGSRRAAESVRSLVGLAESLQSSVSPFKLPIESMPPGNGTSTSDSAFVN
ncbi:MAG: methyl-accepting chemotaxis protein [Acidobacteria bacterium]|nr:methyl-accepting chemotaxis protein [Acidobacteriota bacterium]